MKKKVLLFLILLILSISVPAFAETITTQVKTTKTFTEESTITLTIPQNQYTSYTYVGTPAILADGNTVTINSNGNFAITIDIIGERAKVNNEKSSFEKNIGIHAVNGGTVDFSLNSVTVRGRDKGIFASQGSTIKLGDDSKIYAYKQNGNVAVAAGHNGVIEIGDNARIISSHFSQGAVLSGHGSTITIGDNAYIANIQKANTEVDSFDATGNLGGRYGLFAYGTYNNIISKIVVGDDAVISTEEGSGLGKSRGVVAGDGVNIGIIEIGDRATITTALNDLRSYGIYALNNGSYISLGKNSKINTTSDLSCGSVSYNGGEIVIKDDTVIHTKGINSYGLYSVVDPTYTLNAISKITINKGVQIKTEGNNAIGVLSYNYRESNSGSHIHLGENSSILTKGLGSYGIYIEGYNTKVSVDSSVTVSTENDFASGIYIYSDATLDITNGSLSVDTSGDYSHGMEIVDVFSKPLSMKNISLRASGDGSDAMFIYIYDRAKLPGITDIVISGENVTESSDKGNLITAISGADVYIDFKDSTLIGNILPGSFIDTYDNNTQYDTNVFLNLTGSSTWQGSMGDGSYLSTYTFLDDYDGSSTPGDERRIKVQTATNSLTLDLKDTSKWLISENSSITNVKMSNSSSIEFLHVIGSNTYQVATIEELSGNGNLIMNIDLSLNGSGDKIMIGKASGKYTLTLQHNNVAEVSEIILIEVTDFTANPEFELAEGEIIKIGGYDYGLEIRNSSQLWLRRKGLNPLVVESSGNALLGILESSKVLDAILANTVVKTHKGLWLTSYYTLQKFDETSLPATLEQHIFGAVSGIDWLEYKGFKMGNFIGLNLVYQEIGEDLIGETANLTTGLYADYRNDSLIIDGFFRVNEYQQTLRLKDKSASFDGSMNIFGLNASIQALYAFNLVNSSYYVAPKARASYSYMSAQEKDFGPLQIKSEKAHSLVTWLGVRTGFDDGNSINWFIEAGWIHDTNPSIILTIDEKKTILLEKNRFEIGAGFTTLTSETSNISLEVSYIKGKDMVAPIKVNFSGSYSF